MAHSLAANYAKNYCNRTPIVKVIVENVVTCFLGGHSVKNEEDNCPTSVKLWKSRVLSPVPTLHCNGAKCPHQSRRLMRSFCIFICYLICAQDNSKNCGRIGVEIFPRIYILD